MTTAWGTRVETERRNRIRLAVAAYSYEFALPPTLTDAEFDDLARRINPQVMTGHPVYDEFFLSAFHPDTGMWVRSYPDLPALRRLYRRATQ